MWSTFFDELVKISAVRKPVKDYRRALTALEEASRSSQGPHGVMSAGSAFHGTQAPADLRGILSEGKILPSLGQEAAQHGPGVYWWKGFPREEYLQTQFDEGVMSKLKTLPDKQPLRRNIKGTHFSPHQVVTGPSAYPLNANRERVIKEMSAGKIPPGKVPPADTMIIDMGSRAKENPKGLRNLLTDAAERKVRTTDSAIFQRARQQIRASNMGKAMPAPTKKELLQLVAKRLLKR